MPSTDYLTRQLATMAPHRAILRAVECRLMGAIELAGPVLDIGIGDGHFASIAYDQPIDVGIDVRSDELVEAFGRGPTVYRSVVRTDATSLPFADGAFATVISNCVIEHIPDNAAVLSEIGRVLRPGGTFATTLPSEHFGEFLLGATVLRRVRARRAADAYGRFFNRISYHHHVEPPSVWHDRLGAAGLVVVDHQYYFSARAHRRFDLCHYLGVPNLIARKLTGRWVLGRLMARPFEWWLRPYYEEPLPQPTGAYQFVRCVRV
ncbi:MAG: class I SAM-dependent methyltransferase [Ilumatobacteraceae bacterium]